MNEWIHRISNAKTLYWPELLILTDNGKSLAKDIGLFTLQQNKQIWQVFVSMTRKHWYLVINEIGLTTPALLLQQILLDLKVWIKIGGQ